MASLTHRVVGFGGRVAVKVSATSSVRIKVGTDAAVTAGVIFSPAVTPDATGFAKCTVAGMTPGVRYYYRVAMTDSTSGTEVLDTATTVGRIQVAPTGPASFTFDFSSCCDSDPGGFVASTDSAAMASIAARNDAFFLHLGDLFYDDAGAPSVANYQSRIGARFAVANHARVFATMPSTFIPSDHDYSFANNGTGTTDTTARTQYNQVYRQMMPQTPVPATTGIYHTFVWGRVRFIMLDCRSFPTTVGAVDDANKTMLGATQKQWFKDTVLAAAEPVIVFCGDASWTGTGTGEYAWMSYKTERTELANFMKAQTTKRFVYLGGDMHSVAANNGSLSGQGIPSFQASPLNNNGSTKGGDWTSGPFPGATTTFHQQYGRVVVTDTGTTISLAFNGYSSDNVSHAAQTVTVNVTGPTAAVSNSRATSWRSSSRITGTKSTNWRVLASTSTISVGFVTSTSWAVAAGTTPTSRVTATRLSTWSASAAQGAVAVETWNGTVGAPWPAQWTVTAPSAGAQPGAITAGSAAITGTQQGQITTGATAFSVGPTALLSGMPVTRDTEVTLDVGFDTYTADAYAALNVRSAGFLRATSDYVTANGYYLALINEPVAGTGGAWELGRVVGGVKTVLRRTPYTYTGRVRVRLQTLGASVAVRVWDVSAVEPTAWGWIVTDPAPYLGDGRVLLTAQAGAAAAARSATFENLVVAPVALGRVNSARVTSWNANGTELPYSYGGYNVGWGPAEQTGPIKTLGVPTLYENSVSTGAVVPVPAATQAGELLVAVVSQGSGTPIGTPTAWTMLGHAEVSGAALAMFGRFATAAEPATYTFPTAPEPVPVSGMMARVSGVVPTILDGPAVAAATQGPTTLGLPVPSISTVSVDTLLLSAYTIGTTSGAAPVPPVGMTTVQDTAGVGEAAALAREIWQPTGPTGVRTWSMQPSVSPYEQAAVMVALRSAAVATNRVEATRSTSFTVRTRTLDTRSSRWTVSAAGGVNLVTAERRAAWVVVSADVTASVLATRATSWRALLRIVGTGRGSWSTFSQTPVGAPVTARPGMRLRVYASNGEDLGPLPAPQGTSVAYPLNDVGSLTLSYSVRAPRSDLLGQPCEIAVEVSPNSGLTWIEPPDSRFVYIADGMDPRSLTPSYDVEARSLVWVLSKAIVLPNNLVDAEGKRSFRAVTPGVILKTLFNEAQERGAMEGILHGSFNTGSDSSGEPWFNTHNISYEPGIDYLAVLRDLAEQGFIDFRMQGHSLEIYNPSSVMARDRTVGSGQVVFLPGRDITEAPFRRTWENLASFAYYAGDQRSIGVTNPAAITPWGRWERFISDSSTSDIGTMIYLTQAELALSDRERTEYTRGLDFTRAFSRPFWDYRVGDYVWTTVDGVSQDRMRIRQLTLTSSEQGVVAGNVVLNDRFLEADVRQQRRINRITHGASSGAGDGSTPGDPAAGPGATKMPPARVSGLVGSTNAYLGPGGFPQAQVTLSWAAVTTNSDGTALDDLDHYEVFQRPSPSDILTRQQVATTTETTHSMSPYITGSNWLFSVRAVDTAGNRGLLSTEILVPMARDAIPPQAPSSPAVSDYLGSLLVKWDGNPATGQWPGDFDHVEVHASTVNNFTPTAATQVNRMYGKGSVSLVDLAFGIPVYVKLVAVDTSDLKSAPSAQAFGTPHRLVGTDFDPDAITYEQIAFKDPGNIVPDGSFESATYRATVQGRSSAQWSFTTANFTHGDYAATIDASQASGSIRRLELMSAGEAQQILATDKLFTRFAFNASAGANGTVQLVVEWILGNGTLQRSVLPAVLRNATWQQAAGQQTAPAGVEKFRVYLEVDPTATLGVWYFDTVEVRRTVGTAIIQDAAIKNAQIDNLAVNSAKISDLSVAKLTAGTLNASVLLGNQITTATSGARVEMSPTGIRLFDANNVVKAHFNPAVGQLRTYSTADVTHISNTHGLQVGNDNGQNLAIDDNEIMSRLNGSYGTLLLNREGGQVIIGGRIGGFPTGTTGQFPADTNHQVVVRAALGVYNVSDASYGDEYPPVLIGAPGGAHVFIDSNEIGATASTGDAAGTLNLQAPGASGVHHNESIIMASGSAGIRRYGSFGAGTRGFILYGNDSGNNAAIRVFNGAGGPYVSATNAAGNALVGFESSNVNLPSSREIKHSISPLGGVLDKVRGAPAKRWKYRDSVEAADVWHVGPMLEDLPAEVIARRGDPTAEAEPDRSGAVSLPSMVGLLWEAVRELLDRIETLEASRGRQP